MPISPFKLLANHFNPIVAKVGNRVIPWRERYNTSSGKVCPINAFLSPLPMFMMGFYRFREGIHAGLDKHRSTFYWNSTENKKKYMLVSWKLMCRPKSKGGLGFIDTSLMNKCLIIK